MKEIKDAVREQMDDVKSHIEVDKAGEILKDQRCKIQLR